MTARKPASPPARGKAAPKGAKAAPKAATNSKPADPRKEVDAAAKTPPSDTSGIVGKPEVNVEAVVANAHADTDPRAAPADASGGATAIAEVAISPRPTTASKAKLAALKHPVAKEFILTDNEGKAHTYAVGTTEMPRAHAEHWFAKAHGVELK